MRLAVISCEYGLLFERCQASCFIALVLVLGWQPRLRPDLPVSSLDVGPWGLSLSHLEVCVSRLILCLLRNAKQAPLFKSLIELAGCWTQTWRPALSVCSARAHALVPCLLSASPAEACSVAAALAESGFTTCGQCSLFSSVTTALQLLRACGSGFLSPCLALVCDCCVAFNCCVAVAAVLFARTLFLKTLAERICERF